MGPKRHKYIVGELYEHVLLIEDVAAQQYQPPRLAMLAILAMRAKASCMGSPSQQCRSVKAVETIWYIIFSLKWYIRSGRCEILSRVAATERITEVALSSYAL